VSRLPSVAASGCPRRAAAQAMPPRHFSSRIARPVATLLLPVVGIACGGAANTIAAYKPRQRQYEAGPYAQHEPGAKPSDGSLFSEAKGGYLEDTRAVRVGDVVVVRIDESADAHGGATTKTSKESNAQAGATALFGLTQALQKAYPGVDSSRLLEYAAKSNFVGMGDTSRKGVLQGSIAVRVARELPNGDLYVEGTKIVLINNEEYHLYLSGVARPADIAQDNSIPSSRIADAQVEFTGRGDVADQQRKGWLARFFDTINPF
jgi:flagellar L-ring protein precursor FlgH